MLRRHFVLLAIVSAFSISPAVVHAGAPKPGGSTIVLSPAPGFGAIKGKAKSKVSPKESQLQVEIENARVFAGEALTVTVDGVNVGSIIVSPLGAGKLSLNTKAGAVIPAITSGSTVAIRTSTGAILTGTF